MKGTSSFGRTPSMQDVAATAGVSAQTVSRALRGETNVSEATRSRVLSAVADLGYKRNSAARALSSGRSRTLGLIVLDDGGQYSRAVITASVERAAAAAGYAVQIVTVPTPDAAQVERAIQRLGEQDVEGIVISVPLIDTTGTITKVIGDTPTVTLDGSHPTAIRSFGADQHEIGQTVTEYLLELGHEQVWHVAGPQEWIEGRARLEGWAAALKSAGGTPPPALIGDWTAVSGYRHGLVLAHIPDVTAVFVASDEMAFGVLKAFHEQGREVPADISVVGVDDIALAEYAFPALTTIKQDFAGSGAAAVRALLGSGDGGDPAPVPSAKLVIRHSSAPPRR